MKTKKLFTLMMIGLVMAMAVPMLIATPAMADHNYGTWSTSSGTALKNGPWLETYGSLGPGTAGSLATGGVLMAIAEDSVPWVTGQFGQWRIGSFVCQGVSSGAGTTADPYLTYYSGGDIDLRAGESSLWGDGLHIDGITALNKAWYTTPGGPGVGILNWDFSFKAVKDGVLWSVNATWSGVANQFPGGGTGSFYEMGGQTNADPATLNAVITQNQTFSTPVYTPKMTFSISAGPAIVENTDTSEIFSSIQAAIDDSDTLDGHTIEITDDINEGIVDIDKDLTIQGGSVHTVYATTDTGSSGDARGWFVVDSGVALDVEDLNFDGNGHLIYQGFRHKGEGSFTNCGFNDIKYNESTAYQGTAIATAGSGPVDFDGCTFTDIGRVGVGFYTSAATGSVLTDCQYTGKGVGDWLDYFVEVNGGAQATVDGCTITECRGVATSDGSDSAAFNVTEWLGAGSTATITCSLITDNSIGIGVGFGSSDGSTVIANNNNICGNDIGIDSVSTVTVDAENNWWGSAFGPLDTVGTSESQGPGEHEGEGFICGDLNTNGLGDEVIGLVDYCDWIDDDVSGCAPIPEVPTIIMLSLGLLGLCGFIWFRRHKNGASA